MKNGMFYLPISKTHFSLLLFVVVLYIYVIIM